MCASRQDPPPPKRGKKVRVAFRRNRAKPPRAKNWTEQAREVDDNELDTQRSEHIAAKGALSRRRTITEYTEADADACGLKRGVVIAMRGLYVEVEDGTETWSCTVRRVLRTRLIKDRHPVTVGDRVLFRSGDSGDAAVREGVIESVRPRTGELKRYAGRRVHTIVANVDQALIISSAAQPSPKPHLIDRYIVAALAGEIEPVICMNKIDLDTDAQARALLERYDRLGLSVLCTSATTGEGIEALRRQLAGKESVIAGQSGVGKSSLLNVVQPGLKLRTGDIVEHTQKGRHTTTTASLIRLDVGGYVVDTPGVKSFDISIVPHRELERLFSEFVPYVPDCHFPDCSHTHETGCAVKAAVERGAIHPERYDSYVRLYEEHA